MKTCMSVRRFGGHLAMAAIATGVFGAVVNGQEVRDIVHEAQRRAEAKSQRYEGTLQVVDRRGKTSEKRWQYDRLGSHGNSKAVLRFTAPAEVKGVALLIVNHPDRASDQWMWTPALARERRIALQDRSTRFFGTDFSFEDLEERDVEQYDYGCSTKRNWAAFAAGRSNRSLASGRDRSTRDRLSGFARTITCSCRSRASSKTSSCGG